MVGAGPPSTPFRGFGTARRGCRACARHDGVGTTVPPTPQVGAHGWQPVVAASPRWRQAGKRMTFHESLSCDCEIKLPYHGARVMHNHATCVCIGAKMSV